MPRGEKLLQCSHDVLEFTVDQLAVVGIEYAKTIRCTITHHVRDTMLIDAAGKHLEAVITRRGSRPVPSRGPAARNSMSTERLQALTVVFANEVVR